MIDLRLVRDDPDRVRASQRARGEDPAAVDALLAADERRRAAVATADDLRAEQKTLGRKVGRAAPEDRPHLLEHAKQFADEVKAAEAEQAAADETLRLAHRAVSNVVIDGVPAGGEDNFVLLETAGEPPAYDVEPSDHVAVGERVGAFDTERGAKVSGARFYYLTGPGALLEFALLNLAMEQATAAGLTPVIAPALVRPEAMEGTGFLGAHAEEIYRIERDDLYLVGTSEVPLAAYHSNEILDLSAGPRRYAGYSACFRREAGSYGKDTRGIFRVHWFDKVEMFSFVRPEDAEDEHARLLAWEKEFLDKLELQLPRHRRRRGGSRVERRPQVRLRGVVPGGAALPRADLGLQLHDLPGPPARGALPRRQRQAAAGRHAQRHPLRHHPHDRVPARGAPARGRIGLRPQSAAPAPRRS